MKTKKIKFAGPSKKMMEALENEGLIITWPKTVKEESDLAIEGTFYTGCDWEKLVSIDLRGKVGLQSKTGVDNAIAYQLREAYENFDIDEEVRLNIGGNGAPDAARLVEDIQEQEKRLERFTDVAYAVAEGREIPAEDNTKEVTIMGKDAKRLCAILEPLTDFKLVCPFNNEEKAFVKMICDELRNKIKEG